MTNCSQYPYQLNLNIKICENKTVNNRTKIRTLVKEMNINIETQHEMFYGFNIKLQLNVIKFNLTKTLDVWDKTFQDCLVFTLHGFITNFRKDFNLKMKKPANYLCDN